MPTFAICASRFPSFGPHQARWSGFVSRLPSGQSEVVLTAPQAYELGRTGLVMLQKLSDAEPSDTPGGTLDPKEIDELRAGVSELRGLVNQADTAATLVAIHETLSKVMPLLERYVG